MLTSRAINVWIKTIAAGGRRMFRHELDKKSQNLANKKTGKFSACFHVFRPTALASAARKGPAMQCNWEYIYQANPEQKSTQHRATETEDTRTITQQEKEPPLHAAYRY